MSNVMVTRQLLLLSLLSLLLPFSWAGRTAVTSQVALLAEQEELAEAFSEEESAADESAVEEVDEEEEEDEEEDLGNPPLCDKWIVRKECKVMDLSNNIKKVSISELSWVMSVTRPSLISFLKSIGFQKAGEKWGQEEFSCQKLCEAVVEAIPEETRPPTSDMACRTGQGDEPAVVCDVDVSPEELAIVDFDTDHKDFHEGHPVEEEEDEDKQDLSITGHAIKSADVELMDLTPEELTIRLANRFRIYPKLSIDIDEDVGEVELDNETHVEPPSDESSLAESETNSSGYCGSICRYYSDCQRYPYSCSGCRGCQGSSYSPSPSPYHYYPAPAPTPSPYHHYPSPTPAPRPAPSPSPSSVPSWLADVEKVNIKAQAYVAHALQVAPKSKSLLKKWFGRSDSATVQKAMYVLNSLSGMLGNVAYKKGPQCGANTYAYVYPRAGLGYTKNSKGEFIFYLCSVYFRSDLGEKIETITHEGSHHALAYTDDVWADAAQTRKAYGRSTCQRLAREYPDRAIKNADSHCYFINDLNGHR